MATPTKNHTIQLPADCHFDALSNRWYWLVGFIGFAIALFGALSLSAIYINFPDSELFSTLKKVSDWTHDQNGAFALTALITIIGIGILGGTYLAWRQKRAKIQFWLQDKQNLGYLGYYTNRAGAPSKKSYQIAGAIGVAIALLGALSLAAVLCPNNHDLSFLKKVSDWTTQSDWAFEFTAAITIVGVAILFATILTWKKDNHQWRQEYYRAERSMMGRMQENTRPPSYYSDDRLFNQLFDPPFTSKNREEIENHAIRLLSLLEEAEEILASIKGQSKAANIPNLYKINTVVEYAEIFLSDYPDSLHGDDLQEKLSAIKKLISKESTYFENNWKKIEQSHCRNTIA